MVSEHQYCAGCVLHVCTYLVVRDIKKCGQLLQVESWSHLMLRGIAAAIAASQTEKSTVNSMACKRARNAVCFAKP